MRGRRGAAAACSAVACTGAQLAAQERQRAGILARQALLQAEDRVAAGHLDPPGRVWRLWLRPHQFARAGADGEIRHVGRQLRGLQSGRGSQAIPGWCPGQAVAAGVLVWRGRRVRGAPAAAVVDPGLRPRFFSVLPTPANFSSR